MNLLKTYGIGYVETTGYSYRFSGNELVRGDLDPEGWNEMLKQMGEISAGITLTSFLNDRFPGEKWADLRVQAGRFASGFDLADPDTVSAHSLAREWQMENGPQFRLQGGYGTLIASLEAEILDLGGQIRLQAAVERMEWEPGKVSFYSGGKLMAEGAMSLFTLPVAVIRHHPEPETLLPRLPGKIQAAREIGVGTVIKIVTEWTSPFWADRAPEALFFFGGTAFPTWWTNRPLDGSQLTGWLGGPAAVGHSGKSKDQLLLMALESLASFSGLTTEALRKRLKGHYIFDWATDPFTGGAYTYTLAASPSARQSWAEPVAGTLYFAGEACHSGTMIGTVEAAVLSAETAAGQMTGR